MSRLVVGAAAVAAATGRRAQCPSSGQRAAVAALSPGLPMLVAPAGVTATLAGPAPRARKGVDVLTGFGALCSIGQLAEPLTHRTLAHPRAAGPHRLRVVAGNIVLPVALAIVADKACR